MAAQGWVDDWGRPIPQPRPGRYRTTRHPSDYVGASQQIFIDDGGQYYTPEPPRHYRAASTATGMRPAQIVINNENHVIEDHPEYERPRSSYGQRVYLQDQQIIQVARQRSPSDYETRRAIDDLERLKKEKEKEDLEAQIAKDIEMKHALKEEQERKKKEEEKELKKRAVEEWKAEEEKKEREKKEKEAEREKLGQEYMRQQLRREGWTEEEIDAVINNKEKKGHASPGVSSTTIVLANAKRPQFMKVDKRHIDPQTLDAYGIEWAWSDEEGFIHIFRYLSESEREVLFEHTRKLKEVKEKKYIKFAEVETTTIKSVDRDRHGRLVISRKKERPRSKSPAVKKTFFMA